jgi:hypothetical protein
MLGGLVSTAIALKRRTELKEIPAEICPGHAVCPSRLEPGFGLNFTPKLHPFTRETSPACPQELEEVNKIHGGD